LFRAPPESSKPGGDERIKNPSYEISKYRKVTERNGASGGKNRCIHGTSIESLRGSIEELAQCKEEKKARCKDELTWDGEISAAWVRAAQRLGPLGFLKGRRKRSLNPQIRFTLGRD